MEVNWTFKTYDELSKLELYQILHLRHEVFVIEQRCYYQDLDFNDMKSIHLMGRVGDEIVAYTRVFPLGTLFDNYLSFGRVLVTQPFRKKGVGHLLLKEILRLSNERWRGVPIKISAQTYLVSFYESYGFSCEGEEYMDAGIPHINMTRG